jgi:hypothetical protein
MVGVSRSGKLLARFISCFIVCPPTCIQVHSVRSETYQRTRLDGDFNARNVSQVLQFILAPLPMGVCDFGCGFLGRRAGGGEMQTQILRSPPNLPHCVGPLVRSRTPFAQNDSADGRVRGRWGNANADSSLTTPEPTPLRGALVRSGALSLRMTVRRVGAREWGLGQVDLGSRSSMTARIQ